jgi:hypothetical protein
MNQQNTETQSVSDDEISLTEIIDFFAEHLKDILLCSLIGAVIGACYLWINSTYVNTIVIRNDFGADIALIRKLSQDLPLYAKEKEELDDFYKKIANEKFWIKNLKPVFSITKEDLKEIKEKLTDKVETGASINRLELTYQGKDKSKNTIDTEEVFNFLKTTFLRIKIKELFENYKLELQVGKLGIDKKIIEIKNEISYLKIRAKNLEELKNRFPSNQSASINQVLDPKDSASKYLPVSTQLVAIYSELNNLDEQLKRNQDNTDAYEVKEKIYTKFESVNNEEKSEIDKLKIIFNTLNEESKNLERSSGYKLSTAIALRNLANDVNNILLIDKNKFEILDRRSELNFKPLSVLFGAFAGLMFGIFFSFALKVKKKYKEEKENRKNLEVKELTNA